MLERDGIQCMSVHAGTVHARLALDTSLLWEEACAQINGQRLQVLQLVDWSTMAICRAGRIRTQHQHASEGRENLMQV